MKKSRYPLYILRHPIDGFEELKYRKQFSVPISLLIVALFFLVEVFRYQLTGFIFNRNNQDDLNVLFILARTVVIFFVWAVTNWLVCSLMEGKGFFKEVWVSSAYALVPYIIIGFFTAAFSNVIVNDEIMLVNYIYYIGIFWSAVLIIVALKSIHEFSVSKTIISILITVFGIAVVLFVVLLSFTVYQQVFNMFRTIFSEIMFRL